MTRAIVLALVLAAAGCGGTDAPACRIGEAEICSCRVIEVSRVLPVQIVTTCNPQADAKLAQETCQTSLPGATCVECEC